MLVKCIECGQPLSTQAATCPHCGAPAPKPVKKPRTGWLVWPVGIVMALVVLAWILPPAPHSQEAQDKALARKTIEACWREQQRKSLSPETQRFIAGACEQGEADFYRKYGHKP
jgi:hypothetical protein